MIRIRFASAALAVAAVAMWPKVADAGRSERSYQDSLCAGMTIETALPNGGRVDCLSPIFAIEVDFSEKWHQAIGQSLYYAAETGLEPAIILICRKSERTCLGHSLRLQSTIAQWALPITVFECGVEAVRIEFDCLLRVPGS